MHVGLLFFVIWEEETELGHIHSTVQPKVAHGRNAPWESLCKMCLFNLKRKNNMFTPVGSLTVFLSDFGSSGLDLSSQTHQILKYPKPVACTVTAIFCAYVYVCMFVYMHIHIHIQIFAVRVYPCTANL